MYEWLPTSTAPENFPIEGISATLLSKEHGSTRIPQELYCSYGWVKEGAIELMNDDVKPIPDRLLYKWLSLRERKFYLYDGEFPTDLILKYFKEGFISPIDDQKSTYKNIIFALAPTGKICIYLSGKGVTKDVVILQGKEYKIESDELKKVIGIYENLDKYIDERLKDEFKQSELKAVESTSYDVTKWTNAYKHKYNWIPNTIINKKIMSLYIESYNGERLYYNDTGVLKKIEPSSIPKKFNIEWKEQKGDEKNVSVIDFDEEEIFKAFAALESGNDKIIIQPEINSLTFVIQVFVKNSKNVIELKKCKFETR